MKNDQRKSLFTKGQQMFDNTDAPTIGKSIKLLAKSFNTIFIDELDINNYMEFIKLLLDRCDKSEKCKILNNRAVVKIIKRHALDDILFNNFSFFNMDQIHDFVTRYINNILATREFGMQSHREVIDICKKGFNITKSYIWYYYLAYCVNHMCICCYKPANAHKTAIKYYELCIDNGFIEQYEKYEQGFIATMYGDLIELYEQCIVCDDLSNVYKHMYFEKIIHAHDMHCIYNITQQSGVLNRFSMYKYIISSALSMHNIKFFIDNFEYIKYQTYEYSHYDIDKLAIVYFDNDSSKFDNYLEYLKDIQDDQSYNETMMNIYGRLNMYKQMTEYLVKYLQCSVHHETNKASHRPICHHVLIKLIKADVCDNMSVGVYKEILKYSGSFFDQIMLIDKISISDDDYINYINEMVNDNIEMRMHDFYHKEIMLSKLFIDSLLKILKILKKYNSPHIVLFKTFLENNNMFADGYNYDAPCNYFNGESNHCYLTIDPENKQCYDMIVYGNDVDYDFE